jgi:SAM-dependent methyltransferase
MDESTCTALAELNRAFYEDFASDFSETRRGWLPGFDLILPHIEAASNVLDLGCGNARLLSFLTERGWRGGYTGLDSSPELLRIAALAASATSPDIATRFAPADFLKRDWPTGLSLSRADAVISLAVLHHIPGRQNRARFLAQCRNLVTESGVVILSTWQFLVAPRLRARILPWSAAGINDEQVEPDDYLLGWGQGNVGRRYCAWIGREEMDGLASEAGLKPVAHYIGDGREGNLNLYGVYSAD